MAPRRKGPPAGAVKAAADAAGSSMPAEKQEPIKVSLYDAGQMKTAMDDAAREVVLNAGYDEDLKISNIKMLIGFTAIGFAVYSQFGPGKFPANWWTVAICVASYCILTVLLSVYSSMVEGHNFLVTKSRRAGDTVLYVSSRLMRFDDQYTLVIANRVEPPKNKDAAYREVTATDSLAKFFHEDGYLSDAAFLPWVESLLQQFEDSVAKKSQ